MLNKLKNQGAWFRANKYIRSQVTSINGGFTNAFKAALMEDEAGKFQTYVDAVNELRVNAGLSENTGIEVNDLAATYAQIGIPLEVWMGYLRFDSYTPVTKPGGKKVYVPDHATEAREAGIFIRDTYRTIRLTIELNNDIRNVLVAKAGNPGGIADAHKELA